MGFEKQPIVSLYFLVEAKVSTTSQLVCEHEPGFLCFQFTEGIKPLGGLSQEADRAYKP